MSWNDADIASGELDNLDLARRSAREGNVLLRKADQAAEVVCSLICHQEFSASEFIDADAVLQRNDDLAHGEFDGTDGADGVDLGAGFLLRFVPQDDLVYCQFSIFRLHRACRSFPTLWVVNFGRRPPPTSAMILETPII